MTKNDIVGRKIVKIAIDEFRDFNRIEGIELDNGIELLPWHDCAFDIMGIAYIGAKGGGKPMPLTKEYVVRWDLPFSRETDFVLFGPSGEKVFESKEKAEKFIKEMKDKTFKTGSYDGEEVYGYELEFKKTIRKKRR